MATMELDPKFASIIDRLVARSNGMYDADFVRHLVEHVAEDYKGAPVQDYVHVLVAKEAADELRRLHALDRIAS
ncbi:MAG: hypothetical protein JWL72_4254 [Ilumatobacteraceae bacterium]|nr:hypothetical protein [Ilumatobacteraceae bacterium]